MWNEIKNKNPQKKKGYELENQSNTGRKEGGREVVLQNRCNNYVNVNEKNIYLVSE